MNRTILSKDVKIEDNKVIITEEIETKLDQSQLELKLRDIQLRKARAKEQNTRLINEYNGLANEETELKELIAQLKDKEDIEKI